MTTAAETSSTYIYDLECFRNFFSATFIPYNTPQDIIDLYIRMDLVKNEVAKKEILEAIGAKVFVIYRAIEEGVDPATPFPLYKDENNITQIQELYAFFKKHKTLIGYNSFNYDMTMLDIFIHYASTFNWANGLKVEASGNKIHICEFLYYHSQECIGGTAQGSTYRRILDFYKGRRYFRPFIDFDIQKILYLDKTMTALKAVMITLKWYRIQDLPIHYSHLIKPSQIDKVLDYNVNDVLGTDALVKNQQKELDLRAKLSGMYDIDLRNMSRSSIGKNLMTKFYSERSGLKPYEFMDLRTNRSAVPIKKIIKNNIRFNTKFYQTILDTLQRYSIFIGLGEPKRSELKVENITPYISITTWRKSFQKIDFISNNKGYTLATGGLHSKDDPKILWANEGEVLADPDVSELAS